MARLPAVWAHRGASADAPENTLTAFRAAIDAGADGVEFDVHLTADGHAVVLHDETLDRTTSSSGAVARLDLATVRYARIAGGERVPLLTEVLDLLAGSALAINIELKTDREPYPGLARQVIAVVRDADLVSRVVLSSFATATVREIVALAPDIPAALISSRGAWRTAVAVGASGLHPGRRACTQRLVSAAHAAGLAVRVWTLDDPAHLIQAAQRGVDAVITNAPRVATQVFSGVG